MARRPPTNHPVAPNVNLKLQIAKWKAITGSNQYELARLIGISPSQLSQITSGLRPGKQYIERINHITTLEAS